MSCRDDEILIEGPAGTGKTRGVLEKMHLALSKYPGSRGLICRKTRASMTQSVLVTFEEKVIPVGWKRDKIQRKNRSSYPYPNGSELVVGGLDDPDKIMSTDYDMIGLFEGTEATLDDHEKLTSRLRNWVIPYNQLIVDCNPGAPTHWLNVRANEKVMRRILSRHQDNPRLWDARTGRWTERGATYIAKLDRLSGARLQRLRYGKWAMQEGMVYEDWDAAVHHIDRFEIPADWRRIRSIDFGYTNPFVCQWWAIDDDGRMYMYREIYMSQRLTSEHADLINALSEGENIEDTICDHDAQERAVLESKGIWTMPADKRVELGIQKVVERLKRAGDGKPRLYILRDSLVERDESLDKKPASTVEELDGYHYPPSRDGHNEKEHPVKKDDHGMDAKRYAVMYEDGSMASEVVY